MLSFDMAEISSILNDINLITKVKFDLYDKDFNILHGENQNMCEFCKIIRTCPECYKKCIESDREGFLNSQNKRSAYAYKCHMGLTENITPIICDDSIVGYIVMGQKLMKEDVEIVKRKIDDFPDSNQRAYLLDALKKMKYTSQKELDAMCNLVEMCASYLRMKKLIKFRETPVEVLVKNYVTEHISDELNIKTLCRAFKMSKSSLYALSSETFGMGITEYVRKVRMEAAKDMLLNTEEPISSVAERVGYNDSNYFTKVFKKHNGFAPCEWRRKNKQ